MKIAKTTWIALGVFVALLLAVLATREREVNVGVKRLERTPFAVADITRVELTGPVDRADLEVFMEEVYRRLTGAPLDTAEVRPGRETLAAVVSRRGVSSGTSETMEPFAGSPPVGLESDVDG